MSVVSSPMDPTLRHPVNQGEHQQYELLENGWTTALGTFLLITLDALAIADVAHGRPPLEVVVAR